MGRRDTKQQLELTPEEVLIYSCAMAGVPIKELVERSGKCRQTIAKWIKKVREFVNKGDFDINEYRAPVHGLYGLWLRSVALNLLKCDSTVTIAMGKGMQYFVEKSESDTSDIGINSPDELRRKLNKLGVVIAEPSLGGDEDSPNDGVPS